MLKELDTVVLTDDVPPHHELKRGDVGTIGGHML